MCWSFDGGVNSILLSLCYLVYSLNSVSRSNLEDWFFFSTSRLVSYSYPLSIVAFPGKDWSVDQRGNRPTQLLTSFLTQFKEIVKLYSNELTAAMCYPVGMELFDNNAKKISDPNLEKVLLVLARQTRYWNRTIPGTLIIVGNDVPEGTSFHQSSEVPVCCVRVNRKRQ